MSTFSLFMSIPYHNCHAVTFVFVNDFTDKI